MSQNKEVMSVEQLASAARSRAYAIFVEALEYPDEALHARISSGDLMLELVRVLNELDNTLAEEINEDSLKDARSLEDLTVEHTRLFDGSASRTPTPLYGSTYIASRDRAVEEPLRFYDYFGLKLTQESREFPDYIGTQLEFLHYLTYSQIVVKDDQRGFESFRKAEQDFLERHPAHWVPRLEKRLSANNPLPFYQEIIRLLNTLLQYCCNHGPAKPTMD